MSTSTVYAAVPDHIASRTGKGKVQQSTAVAPKGVDPQATGPQIVQQRTGAESVVAFIRNAKKFEVNKKYADRPGIYIHSKLKIDKKEGTFSQFFDERFGTASEERRAMLDTLRDQGVLKIFPALGGVVIAVVADLEAEKANKQAEKAVKPKEAKVGAARLAELLG